MISTEPNEWFVTLHLHMKSSKTSPSKKNNVLDPRCPSRLVLARIADKWTALIIQVLASGTKRYAVLQREIGGISQKMLTQTLRSLERDGLIERKVYPEVPPKVEYALEPTWAHIDRAVAGDLSLV